MNCRPLILALACAAIAASGCVSDRPRGANRPPRGARPERVVPVADGRFIDTDANGYGDTNRVIAYVFGDARYQVPIEAEGAFEFWLVDLTGRRIREWAFTSKEVASRRVVLPVGPGFVFDLSLLDAGGSDRLGETEGELSGAFVPREGEEIRFRLTATVVLGRVRPG